MPTDYPTRPKACRTRVGIDCIVSVPDRASRRSDPGTWPRDRSRRQYTQSCHLSFRIDCAAHTIASLAGGTVPLNNLVCKLCPFRPCRPKPLSPDHRRWYLRPPRRQCPFSAIVEHGSARGLARQHHSLTDRRQVTLFECNIVHHISFMSCSVCLKVRGLWACFSNRPGPGLVLPPDSHRVPQAALCIY